MITVLNIVETWLNEPEIFTHFEMRKSHVSSCSYIKSKQVMEIYCNCADFNYKNLDRWNTLPLVIKVAELIEDEVHIVDETGRISSSLIKIDLKHPFSFNRLKAYFYYRHNKIKACGKYLCQR